MPASANGSSSLIEHLNKQVETKNPVATISFERYLLTGQMLLMQADAYRGSNDESNRYIYLMRFASLILDTLKKHPNFNRNNPRYVEFRKKLIEECFPELDRLKLSLSTQSVPKENTMKYQNPLLSPFGLTDASQVDWTHAGAPNKNPLPPPPQFEQKKSMKTATGKTIEKHSLFAASSASINSASTRAPDRSPMYSASVSFPSIQPPTESLIDRPQPVPLPKEIPLGPQEIEVHTSNGVSPGGGETCACSPPPMISTDVVSSPLPPPPSAIEEPPVLEPRTAGLRNVHISVELLESFLRIAKSNTSREIETCAILAGKLHPKSGVFEITTLLVPKQKGTRDQVEMLNEELLLEEVLTKGLMVLGWIHTHPVFQCFLSSIDVHTTLPYQLLLDEAVAIVMAPTDRKRKCGVFRLTTPGGMDLIKECQKRGFHEHKQTKTRQPIYEISSHVFLNPKLSVSVTDMR
eukprot:g4530.t1